MEHLPEKGEVPEKRSTMPRDCPPLEEPAPSVPGDSNERSCEDAPDVSGTLASDPDSPRPDKTMSIIAGFVTLFFIFLLCTMFTVASLPGAGSTGTDHNSSHSASPPGSVVSEELPAAPTPAPEPTPVIISSTPASEAIPVIASSELSPVSPGVQQSGPVSYVTLEPVPTAPVPVVQDISPGLSVPDYGEYFTIYSLDHHDMTQKPPYVSFALSNPPLVIEYTVTPMNISDVKDLDYKILTTVYHEQLTINREYEQAWFRVVARDRDTGKIVAEDGYGLTDSLRQERRLVVYKGGNYRFEFTGAHVTVDLTMNVQKEGNIR
jgi:hypothetical protein